MNEDLETGVVYPREEPPVNCFARYLPFKIQAFDPKAGLVRILQRNDPVVFEAKIEEEPNIVATANFRRWTAMWVKCEVEDLPCWAKVDAGVSTSLISQHMPSVVRKLVNFHPHPLISTTGNVMPIDGRTITQVRFGKHESTDEFTVVEDLNPHVLFGLKFLCDNKS